MEFVAWQGLFFPLMGFLILLFFSNHLSRQATGWIGCTTIFLSLLSFSSLLYVYVNSSLSPYTLTLFRWIQLAPLSADFSIHIDPLSLVMTLIITGVGFLIHIYSYGYMEHEEDYARFFACMNFFVFAMLLLVLAANLLLLFMGWEGVGLASYLLIGYYYSRPTAAKAATKAFIVNRIGDLGFLLGILLTFYLFGTSDIVTITQKAQLFSVGEPLILLVTFLFFIGAVGKSAQIPLHVWLPDAMEGPTPVSALIHAATMVTAGVYLVVRMHALYMLAPYTMHLVGAIGGATALFAALSAVGQTDLKRVLAYSTISQLGIMFLGCGVGAFYAAMFHLTMHAFMKALLFLAAGNVIHMMHGITDMEKMGGLYKKFPITHLTFFIGVLAMSGVPPLAAFFSKDLILEQDYLSGFYTFFYIGLAASILTAFYLTRAYCLTFLGTARLEEKILKSVKEAPRIMLIPVVILAFLSIFGGFLGSAVQHPVLENFLGEVSIKLAVPDNQLLSRETWLSIIGGLVGIGSAAYLYMVHGDRIKTKSIDLLKNGFYIDAIYDKLIVIPLKMLAQFIDYILEPKLFLGSLKTIGSKTQGAAVWLQSMQSGQLRSYIAWMTLGMTALIVYFISRMH